MSETIRCPIPGVDPWASGVLNPENHENLVRILDKAVQDAGIPVGYILSPRANYLRDQREHDWLDKFRRHRLENNAGLVFLGYGWDPTVEVRMAAMVGALTRNYILGRMLTMGEVVTEYRALGEVRGTGLFLPNFIEGAPDERRRAMVSDVMLQRFKEGRCQTIIAAASYEEIGKVYGGFLRDHIRQHYLAFEGSNKDFNR